MEATGIMGLINVYIRDVYRSGWVESCKPYGSVSTVLRFWVSRFIQGLRLKGS